MIKRVTYRFLFSTRAIISIGALFVALIALFGAVQAHRAYAADTPNILRERLVTIHDRGQEKVIVTKERTVAAALEQAGIALDDNDTIEPKRSEALIGTHYTVNIYRARPVIVSDGSLKQKIMTAHQSPSKIAEAAGLTLRSEDKTTLRSSDNIAVNGASVELVIDRATPVTLVLYGKKTLLYTQAQTVAELFTEKTIRVAANDHVSVALNTAIYPDMTIQLSRNGKQTVTEEQNVPFAVEKIYDMNRPIGYKEVQAPGVPGKRAITYEVTMQAGAELARTEIQNVITLQPVKQVEVFGLNPGNGLSRNKGANMFTDSKGVVHRETYYDLPMNVTMGSCGGGTYTIRPDGAKIDKDGYILVAAHLGNYPRCSIVETSLGLGKVYDTGGFVARHPHGFDLATDWSNNDGR